ncbi:hypothetical protein C8J57DRAFT_1337712, partial [Mycena rebaudengoi]
VPVVRDILVLRLSSGVCVLVECGVPLVLVVLRPHGVISTRCCQRQRIVVVVIPVRARIHAGTGTLSPSARIET